MKKKSKKKLGVPLAKASGRTPTASLRSVRPKKAGTTPSGSSRAPARPNGMAKRHTLYKHMLKLMPEKMGHAGFCKLLERMGWDGGQYYGDLTPLRELYKQQPKNPYSDLHWWEPGDMVHRTSALKKAIAMSAPALGARRTRSGSARSANGTPKGTGRSKATATPKKSIPKSR